MLTLNSHIVYAGKCEKEGVKTSKAHEEGDAFEV